MARLFERLPSARMRGFIVWLPMVGGDDETAADRQADRVHDGRVANWWDGDRRLGRALAPVLKLRRGVAWDVYLVYGPDATWRANRLPAPAVWMHQLDDGDPAHRLDEPRLEREVRRLLARP